MLRWVKTQKLAEAMLDANIKMLYVGVESDNAENLKLVQKRQEPGETHRDMLNLQQGGFALVAMTIIGLPYDTEESIMQLADWVTQISKYQTANLLTPLPATSNWESLAPLNENGELLQEGEMRPYHLYTGRQLVHDDQRWSMDESRELFDKYTGKLKPVDDLYGRIFRVLRSYRLRLATTGKDFGDNIFTRITDATEALKIWSDPVSLAGKEFGENISQSVSELVETLRTVSQPLATTQQDVAEGVRTRINELTESLKTLSDPLTSGGNELAANVSGRITELKDMLNRLTPEPQQYKAIRE